MIFSMSAHMKIFSSCKIKIFFFSVLLLNRLAAALRIGRNNSSNSSWKKMRRYVAREMEWIKHEEIYIMLQRVKNKCEIKIDDHREKKEIKKWSRWNWRYWGWFCKKKINIKKICCKMRKNCMFHIPWCSSNFLNFIPKLSFIFQSVPLMLQ